MPENQAQPNHQSHAPSVADETMANYDRTAAEFAARWGDLRLERALSAFCRQLAGAQLADAQLAGGQLAGRQPGRRWRVLDLGCGPGRDADFLMQLGCDAAGLDLSAGMLAEARRRLPNAPLVRADLRRVPFASGSFDGVWACASLLHVPHAEFPPALAEVARLLRPGGILYLALKGGRGERWVATPGGDRVFFAYHQAAELETALGRAGFRILERWTEADRAGRREPWLNTVAAL